MGKVKQGGAGAKKYSRTKRKTAGKGTPISLFSRGKITGEEYFRLTGQR